MMRLPNTLIPLLFLVGWLGIAFAAPSLRADQPQFTDEQLKFFENKIRPLLADRCWSCHSEKEQKGDLRLDTFGDALQGGESGAAIVPGNNQDSLLLQAVRYESFEMPPDGKLSDQEIESLEQWVRMGVPWPGSSSTPTKREAKEKITAEDRAWWAFQPLKSPTIPKTEVVNTNGLTDEKWSREDWNQQEIDQLVLQKLLEHGLTPAPPADRISLIRRISFDLIGLPPTPEEVAQFVDDTSPDAYEKLVDRLLRSPHYGERWARHWLDLVRYADSDGYRIDHYRPNAWMYRDYVIRSFNQDKPYDRFVQEQLAGDELFPSDQDALIATGFLRHWIYEYNNRDAKTQWTTILNDITDTTGDVFMGMGMQCAKCHDHKFDPILQKDYFRLQAFFAPLIPKEDSIATPEELAKHREQRAQWESATATVREKIAAIEAPFRKKAEEEAITKFPPDIQAIARKPAAERTAYETQIYYLVARQIDFEYSRIDDKIKGSEKESVIALRKELAQFDKLRPAPLATALTATDLSTAPPAIFIPKKSSEPISPGFLTLLDETDATILPSTNSSTTGRRATLAKWLTRADHPLTSRVMANRLWQHHFGKGLAPNSSDFGRLGGLPSHPELLDWLASQLVSDGWSLKKLHRRIVLSQTYQQSTQHPKFDDYQKIDPANQYYWRSDTRRLEAEQIRDAILAVSGLLKHELAKPEISNEPTANDGTLLIRGGEGVLGDVPRRTIYTRVMRNARDPLLDSFDLPLFFASESSRNTTTTPVQSLMLINSPQMLQFADALAQRILRESRSNDKQDQVVRLWQYALGRAPDPNELASAIRFIEQQRDLILDNAQDRSTTLVTQNKIPYRDGQAIAINPSQPQSRIMIPADPMLDTADFTIEGFIQVRSIYDSGSVRTIASKWSGASGEPGWGFGVTGKGSRRKPQTLVMQLWGKNRDGSFSEAALFSDQNVGLDKPYFVAASVQLARPEATPPTRGKVTFYLKDLSNDDEPLQTAVVEHDIASGLSNSSPMVIGGRSGDASSLFDGLIDDVRISRAALNDGQVLFTSENVAESTVGFWRFEAQPGVLDDSSSGGLHATTAEKAKALLDPEVAAFRDLSHAILNSNEFLYVR